MQDWHISSPGNHDTDYKGKPKRHDELLLLKKTSYTFDR
jgi:hypothetical protein